MPVLLEDNHVDENAWKPVEEIVDPNAVTAPPPAGFTTMLTTMVTLGIVLLIAAVAYGPTLVRLVRSQIAGYRVTGARSKKAASTSKATTKGKAGASKKSSVRRGPSDTPSEELGLKAADEDDDEDEEEEDEEEELTPAKKTTRAAPARRAKEESEEEEEEEDEDEEPLEKRFKVGTEALAVNLREKKYLQHNKKVGVVKKVDAKAGKVYIEMKSSGAKLVLKAENVEPYKKARR